MKVSYDNELGSQKKKSLLKTAGLIILSAGAGMAPTYFITDYNNSKENQKKINKLEAQIELDSIEKERLNKKNIKLLDEIEQEKKSFEELDSAYSIKLKELEKWKNKYDKLKKDSIILK